MILETGSTGSPSDELRSDRSIWRTLERIRVAIHLSHEQLAELLRLTSRQYYALRMRCEAPSITSMMALAGRLNLGLDLLVSGNLDYRALALQFKGDLTVLPERYTVHAASRHRTVTNLLNHIEKRLGWETRHAILSRFQVAEPMFENPDALINVRLATDICENLLGHFREERLLREMGWNSYLTHKESAIGQCLQDVTEPRELYERMIGELISKFVENNFHWEIRFPEPSLAVITGSPNADVTAGVGLTYMKSYATCLVRAGFLESIPAYIGLPFVPVKQTQCVSQGDSCCRFEIDLATLKFMQRSVE